MAIGRKTGGRQKGSRNKATVEREQFTCEVIAQATETGQSPLDVMLSIMRSADAPLSVRFKAAIEAAPYIHPKLAAVDMKADVVITAEEEILDQLTGRTRGIPNGHSSSANH